MDDEDPRYRRARSFGAAAAEAYERHRPGYGPEIVGPLLAAGPVRSVIEIGAGTGLATRVLVDAGLSVTAVEPDAAMIAVLRRTCAGAGVTPVEAAYATPTSKTGTTPQAASATTNGTCCRCCIVCWPGCCQKAPMALTATPAISYSWRMSNDQNLWMALGRVT